MKYIIIKEINSRLNGPKERSNIFLTSLYSYHIEKEGKKSCTTSNDVK